MGIQLEGFAIHREVKDRFLKKQASFHKTAIWVIILINPMFIPAEYTIGINLQFSIITRCSLSIITLITLLIYRHFKVPYSTLPFVPFSLLILLISYSFYIIDPNYVAELVSGMLLIFFGAALLFLIPKESAIISLTLALLSVGTGLLLNPNSIEDKNLVGSLTVLSAGCLISIGTIMSCYKLHFMASYGELELHNQIDTLTKQQQKIQSQNLELTEKTRQLHNAKKDLETVNNLLQDHNSNLELKVEERTLLLQKENNEKNLLLYRLAHDFRTPIVNAYGLISLLKQSKNNDETLLYTNKLDLCIQNFDNILMNMMHYASLANDNWFISTINLREMIDLILSELEPTERKLVVNFTPKNYKAWCIESNQEKLQLILSKVLFNAILFDFNETVNIDISIAKKEFESILKIKDQGIGMTPTQQKHAFDMFYRGDQTYAGAGMGLFITKGLVEQLGGSIMLESEKGKGTTVVISLPKNSPKK